MSSSTVFLRLFHFPRWIRIQFRIIWNPIMFRLIGIQLGYNARICTKVFVIKNEKSQIMIGDNFILTSGDFINPLCRVQRACICAERSTSIIEIGNNTGMSSPCIWAKEKITIGNYVNIGGDCIIMDSDAHNLDWRIRDSSEMFSKHETMDVHTAKCAPIFIEDHVLIGTRCIILKGVTIGARSIIAAGSVVTKDIPSDCIAGGNPAKVIRYL